MFFTGGKHPQQSVASSKYPSVLMPLCKPYKAKLIVCENGHFLQLLIRSQQLVTKVGKLG